MARVQNTRRKQQGGAQLPGSLNKPHARGFEHSLVLIEQLGAN
jgi:hypothetical protein